jgi:hypothetical protein
MPQTTVSFDASEAEIERFEPIDLGLNGRATLREGGNEFGRDATAEL